MKTPNPNPRRGGRTAKVLIALRPEELAAVDAARKTIPRATWCRDAIVSATSDDREGS
jgi:hypothetical protein